MFIVVAVCLSSSIRWFASLLYPFSYALFLCDMFFLWFPSSPSIVSLFWTVPSFIMYPFALIYNIICFYSELYYSSLIISSFPVLFFLLFFSFMLAVLLSPCCFSLSCELLFFSHHLFLSFNLYSFFPLSLPFLWAQLLFIIYLFPVNLPIIDFPFPVNCPTFSSVFNPSCISPSPGNPLRRKKRRFRFVVSLIQISGHLVMRKK